MSAVGQQYQSHRRGVICQFWATNEVLHEIIIEAHTVWATSDVALCDSWLGDFS